MVNDPRNPANDRDSLLGVRPRAVAPEIPREIPGAAPGKRLSPEAVRALEEAEARRQAMPAVALPEEIGGRTNGGEPTRFGDWEKKGLAVDF